MLLQKKLSGILAIACLSYLLLPQSLDATPVRQHQADKRSGLSVFSHPGNRKKPERTPPDQNILYSMSTINKNDIWAAGQTNTDYTGQVILEHWNGSAWSIIQPPDSGNYPAGIDLHGIVTLNSNNAYAVGESEYTAYVLHWNGVSWQIEYVNKGGGNLLAVTAVDENDVWAAGSGLFLHWNGKIWHGISNIGVVLHGIAAMSKDDIWAVGDDHTSQQAVIQHWNGSTWKRVDSTVSAQYTSLNAITVVAKNDIWAVGQSGTQTLILHWNGLCWQRIISSNPSANYDELTSISAVRNNDIWAAGFTQMDTCLYYCTEKTLLEHWDGHTWQAVPSPNIPMQDTVLHGITSLSTNNAWAVGTTYSGYQVQYVGQTLIEHWDGQRWKIISPKQVNA